MVIRRLRILLSVALLCCLTATVKFAIAESPRSLNICGLQPGQKLSDVKSKFPSGRVSKSRILKDGRWVYVESKNASAHFLVETAEIVGGTQLDIGIDNVIRAGHTRKHVLNELQDLDWRLDVEWTKSSDVAGYRYSVMRLKTADDVIVLIVFLLSNERVPSEIDQVSEIYLRSSDVFGPYGDSKYP